MLTGGISTMPNIYNGLHCLSLSNYNVQTLIVNSRCLKKNPLSDPHIRTNPILLPKKIGNKRIPVVFIFSGFSGNGDRYLASRLHEDNFAQLIDGQTTKKKAPEALYVFVDALTFWGGSQFINSSGTGQYQDYILKELVSAVKENYRVSDSADKWCIFGGSSGGYGALRMVSQFPQIFSTAVAIAPDSFFNMSLLPEIYRALPLIKKKGGIKKIKNALIKENYIQRKEAHLVLNAIGMGACYAPHPTTKGEILWPINEKGILDTKTWSRWLKHDPIVFLKPRKNNLKKCHIFLECGNADEYYLQYGCRQLIEILKAANANYVYSEFEGSHFDISSRRLYALDWLNKLWS